MGIAPHDRRHFAEEISFRQCLPALDDDADEECDTGDEAESGSQDDRPREAVSEETSAEEHATEARIGCSDAPQAQVGTTAFIKEEVARLLSYAIKVVVERDPDGIVPIQTLGRRSSLARLVEGQISDWFGPETVEATWAEAAEFLGKPTE